MKPLACLLLSFLVLISGEPYEDVRGVSIRTQWVDSLPGVFGFSQLWSYPEGVYRRNDGQLSCDGLCPEGIDQMKDSSGKVISDSLEKFYALVDTSHQYHSFLSEARMYEWAGSNFISAVQLKDGSVQLTSHGNAATHCHLIIRLGEDSTRASVYYVSIRPVPAETFPLKTGMILLDQNAFRQGWIKATFQFEFENTLEPDHELWWKGKVYTRLQPDGEG
ncbi:MAG: hypothetical protein JJ975_00535 [Bacteroidia bacterium]|nr:hypothetical protein [Bacteroidia bacterium]